MKNLSRDRQLCPRTVRRGRRAGPRIPFDEFYLDNGLRVIVHEDRKAPIVAVNIWYHVGSKNEAPGKTGFAHLFEHLMFNGSENHNDEYFRPLQEVGATSMNGTTDFDRTNYFQNRAHLRARPRAVARVGPHGAPARRRRPGRLDEQRGVVQNEKRQGDNAPYGKVFEDDRHESVPAGPSVLVGRHRLDGGLERRDARGRQDVVRDLLRAEQRDARARRRHRRRHGAGEGRSVTSATFRPARR